MIFYHTDWLIGDTYHLFIWQKFLENFLIDCPLLELFLFDTVCIYLISGAIIILKSVFSALHVVQHDRWRSVQTIDDL